MKKYIVTLILILFAGTIISAQTKVITLTDNKVCQLIFPDNIKKYRGGFDPNMFVLDLYENILYIQCLTSFKDSNLSVITDDQSYYIFDVTYNAMSQNNAYIITAADKLHQKTTSATAIKVSDRKASDTVLVTPNSAINKVLEAKNYIFSNNGIKGKNMEIFLKGIYASGDDIYFKLELTNSSQIPFTYNYIGFAAVTQKKGKASSADRYEFTPKGSFIPSNSIKYGQTLTVVYKFDKFTVGKDRRLSIEIIENNGERNFSFFISDKMLLDAQTLN